MLSICRLTSYKTSEDQLKDFEAITPDVLDKVITYIKNFPEVSPQLVWSYILSAAGSQDPDFIIDNQHPVMQAWIKQLIEIAKVDDFHIIDTEVEAFAGMPVVHSAPAELSLPQDLSPEHPVVVALQTIYSKAAVLSDNVVDILVQIAAALASDDQEFQDNLLLTNTTEVEKTAADGGISAAEKQEILDNQIELPITEAQPKDFDGQTVGNQPEPDLDMVATDVPQLGVQDEPQQADSSQELDEVLGDGPAPTAEPAAKPAAKPKQKPAANK